MYAVRLVYLPQWDLEFFQKFRPPRTPYMHDLCRILLLDIVEFRSEPNRSATPHF